MLLEMGADIKAQRENCGSALYAASEYGRERVVQMLLEAGADVNTQGGRAGDAVYMTSDRGY